MKQFIVVGSSAAGIAAVEAIRKRDAQAKITVITDEDYPCYCRCLISYYLAGDIKEEKVIYRSADFFQERNVELILNKKVTRVDPKKNKVVLQDKTQLGYDALLVATGASPKFPDTKGIKKRGVYGFRTIKDATEIAGLLPVTQAACVLGGGLIGLKAAYALSKRNIDVKVIIKSKQVLSQMLDPEAAAFVEQRLKEHGIDVALGQDAEEIIGDEGEIKAVKLASGKVFGCSLVIVGKGVQPNTDLVRDTGIKMNEGILTDENLATAVPNIFAAGDVSEVYDVALGRASVNALWPVAVEQGKVAGANMCGEKVSYPGSVGMNSLEFFGLPVVSLGVYRAGPDAGFEALTAREPKANRYKKLVIRDNILVGAILVGDIANSGVFLRLMRERIDISPVKAALLGEQFGYPDIMHLVRDKESTYV